MKFAHSRADLPNEDLASGRVLFSLPGLAAFPLRLASELFLRATSLLVSEGRPPLFRMRFLMPIRHTPMSIFPRFRRDQKNVLACLRSAIRACWPTQSPFAIGQYRTEAKSLGNPRRGGSPRETHRIDESWPPQGRRVKISSLSRACPATVSICRRTRKIGPF